MRQLRRILLVAVLSIGLAACGSDSNNAGPDTTTPQASDTTLVRTSTTKAEASGTSPCLTKEEITALAGRAPDEVKEQSYAPGWPNGQCRVDWTDVAQLSVSFQQLSSEATAEQRYDETVARYRDGKYKQEVPCSGIGDECYLQCGTGNDTFTGCNGLLSARRGRLIVSSSYGDGLLRLKPTREETIKLFQDLVRAHLANVNTA